MALNIVWSLEPHRVEGCYQWLQTTMHLDAMDRPRTNQSNESVTSCFIFHVGQGSQISHMRHICFRF